MSMIQWTKQFAEEAYSGNALEGRKAVKFLEAALRAILAQSPELWDAISGLDALAAEDAVHEVYQLALQKLGWG